MVQLVPDGGRSPRGDQSLKAERTSRVDRSSDVSRSSRADRRFRGARHRISGLTIGLAMMVTVVMAQVQVLAADGLCIAYEDCIRRLATDFPTGFYAALYADPETRHLYEGAFSAADVVPDLGFGPEEFYHRLDADQMDRIVTATVSWMSRQSEDEQRWHLTLMRRWSQIEVQLELISGLRGLSTEGLLQRLYTYPDLADAFSQAIANRQQGGQSVDSSAVAESLTSAEMSAIRFAVVDKLARMVQSRSIAILASLLLQP